MSPSLLHILISKTYSPLNLKDLNLLKSVLSERGSGPIKVEVFGKIANILISIAEDNPNTILFYFCDIVEGIRFAYSAMSTRTPF